MSRELDRRQFIQAAAGALLAAPASVRCATMPKRKGGINVLFMMTDEQHYRAMSITGNPYIETPNMDRIAREGVLFGNATCVTPYCSPSRASIITGVYPHRHRILLNVSPRRNTQKPLKPDAFPNTECILYQQGYATAHRGKWHLGDKGDFPCYESRAYASKHARDYMKFLDEHLPRSKFAADRARGRYLRRPVRKIRAVRKGMDAFFAIPKNRVAYISIIGRTVISPDLLPEAQITKDVIHLIEQNADRNFMITASWIPPHDLWVIPDPYYSMVDRRKIELPGTTALPPWDQRGKSKQLGDLMGPDGIREYAAIYHGMVKYIDDQIGLILNRLDALGLAKDTLVVFTTDHGDMVGAHGCIGKSVTGFYDDLVRIPLAMRLPGHIKPGTVVKEPVSQIDYMPTILDYAGLPIPQNIHGRSMRPLIERRPAKWRDYAYCQRAGRFFMLRTQRYKYVYGLKQGALALYDLPGDPHEDRNLAVDKSHARTVRAMHRRLMEIMTADGADIVRKFPKDPLA